LKLGVEVGAMFQHLTMQLFETWTWIYAKAEICIQNMATILEYVINVKALWMLASTLTIVHALNVNQMTF
jgi:hypothetical protein